VDLAEAADQAGMSIDLGDKQVDIDNLGRMDDRPARPPRRVPAELIDGKQRMSLSAQSAM
jgi:hypothetical protein